MAGFILGEKSEQSQIFDDSGKRIPVTILKTSPCYLLNITMPQSDDQGYSSVTLGFGVAKSINKPTRGKIEKAGVKTPLRFLKEIRFDSIADSVKSIEEGGKKGIQIGEAKIFIGDELKPTSVFKKGETIDVAGTSKGKGYQGVVKRHHFKGGPKTHGQSDRQRAPGSIGQTTTPGRVYRGKRMAGRMGGERVTVQNLSIVNIDDQGITVKGLVPGYRTGLLEIRSHGL